ncbi:hypothetical protein GGI20_003310 [Coemansia sp. BCRC 34301]|nr:hypothetical protein GGI20_003310 [Coemansia sp. BCRC 34301]
MNRVYIAKALKGNKARGAEEEIKAFRLQVHFILEMVVTLEILDYTAKFEILNAIISAPSTAILQRLEFGNLKLDVVHIVRIVSALPRLATLACNICKAGTVNTAILAPEPLTVSNSVQQTACGSDLLVNAETTNKLKEYAAILEDVPSRQKDWHPDD